MPPETLADQEVTTAKAVKAVSTKPALRPARRSRQLARGAAVGALLLAVGVATALVVTVGEDDEDVPTVASTPTVSSAPTATTPTAPATEAPPAAAPAPVPTQIRRICEPILGNGAPFPITSSARAGVDPASCTEARSTLLTALNERASAVGEWRCVIDLTGQTVGICKSGGRTILARSA